MRLVFAGTPSAAVPSLDALLASRHTVAAVVTRPDAPAGRGQRLVASPVAQRAAQLGIEVLRPRRPSEPAFVDRLSQIAPDCCPVIAYGALIPDKVLAIPARGWVNLHFSLLPAWRGAAPVQHSILHGDEITGATTFRLVSEFDAGPVYGVVTEVVGPADTAGDVLGRLSVTGARLLVATLDGIESGELEARPQPADGISYAPKIGRDDAKVNWKLSATAVDRLVRACTPAPGAWTLLHGANLKIWPFAALDGSDRDAPGTELGPGELKITRAGVLVGTGTTAVLLGDVQPAGKRAMPATDWTRGLRSTADPLVFE
jgi:methionyl-tRNA formyltransferase